MVNMDTVPTAPYSAPASVQLPGITSGTGTALVADPAHHNNVLLTTSSRRYKTDIRSLSGAMAREILKKLRPVLYRSTCAADDPDEEHVGLIAEEVAEICPALVTWDRNGDPQSVLYDRIPVLQLAAQGT
jgi:hypothetical protein